MNCRWKMVSVCVFVYCNMQPVMCIGFKSELFIYYGVPGNIEGR